jgi:hypothetical protein
MTDKKDPKDTQFRKGMSGNPGGKSKAQRANELKASEISAKMRLKTLASMQAIFLDKELGPEDLELLLSTGALKLFKDSEDRAHGTPQQSVNHTSDDRSMSPARELSDAELQAVIDANADPK